MYAHLASYFCSPRLRCSYREGSNPSDATYGLKVQQHKNAPRRKLCTTGLHLTFAVHPIASNIWLRGHHPHHVTQSEPNLTFVP